MREHRPAHVRLLGTLMKLELTGRVNSRGSGMRCGKIVEYFRW